MGLQQYIRHPNRRQFLAGAALTLASAPLAHGQDPPAGRSALRSGTLHGRRAWILENERMRVSTLPGGGFIGEIRFRSDDPRLGVNPMRVPHYPTIDPHTYDTARHGELYGTGIQRRLMAGYMGDFLCFPQFGPGSPAEFALDYGQHGEAVVVEWKQEKLESLPDGGVTHVAVADLPKTQFRVRRSMTLPAAETVCYVEESVENLASFDRPIQWVHHVTFGPPFLELNKTFVDAPVAKTAARDGQEYVEGSWPMVKTPEGETVDQRAFTGRGGIWLLDRSQPKVWFTIRHSEYPVLLGYLYDTDRNPWVLDWQENRRATAKPWDGKVTARAICIGDSPFAQGLPAAVQRGSLFGEPVFRWIRARETQTQRYAFFLARIPESGFAGVENVRVERAAIVVRERTTGREIRVPAARLF